MCHHRISDSDDSPSKSKKHFVIIVSFFISIQWVVKMSSKLFKIMSRIAGGQRTVLFTAAIRIKVNGVKIILWAILG